MKPKFFKLVGATSVKSYSLFRRIQAKLFTVIISGSFSALGSKTTIYPPLRISGQDRISIGAGVFIGTNSWLQTLPYDSFNDVAIIIGDHVSIAGACVISAAYNVVIENDVLVAQNVYIADHSHRYNNIPIPVKNQGIEKVAPVLVKQGAWLSQNCVIGPGVTIGVGSVVGANSFVNQDVPDYCIAVGSPARIIKTFSLKSD